MPEPVPSSILSCSRILLVDDDESVLAVTETMLVRAGYQVLRAISVDDASKIWEQHHPVIGLLLTDIIMPELFGTQLAAKCQREKPSLKVLFMSGYWPETLQSDIPLHEGVNYIRKPFSASALRALVASVQPF
jgi:DNA-binding NtrC family response regulator